MDIEAQAWKLGLKNELRRANLIPKKLFVLIVDLRFIVAVFVSFCNGTPSANDMLISIYLFYLLIKQGLAQELIISWISLILLLRLARLVARTLALFQCTLYNRYHLRIQQLPHQLVA